jgi:hypothetical protein
MVRNCQKKGLERSSYGKHYQEVEKNPQDKLKKLRKKMRIAVRTIDSTGPAAGAECSCVPREPVCLSVSPERGGIVGERQVVLCSGFPFSGHHLWAGWLFLCPLNLLHKSQRIAGVWNGPVVRLARLSRDERGVWN